MKILFFSELAITDWHAANPVTAAAEGKEEKNEEEMLKEEDTMNDEEVKDNEGEKEEVQTKEPEPKMEEKNGWFRVRSVPDVAMHTLLENIG